VAGLDWPEPSSGLRLDDLGLLLEAVRHGHGVALTRKHFAKHLIEKGEVIQLFDVCLANPPHAYYVVHEQNARQRPEVDAFVGWLQAACRSI
jgi:DNA-binding transcriptional LysR family regulator